MDLDRFTSWKPPPGSSAPPAPRRPFGGVVGLVGGLVELDEAVEGLGEAGFSPAVGSSSRAASSPRSRPTSSGSASAYFFWPSRAPPSMRLRVEGGPDIGLRLLADGQAFAEERLGLGPFLLLEEAQADLGEQAGQLGAVLGQGLASLGQLFLEQARRAWRSRPAFA